MDHEKNTKEITPKGNNQIGENPKRKTCHNGRGPLEEFRRVTRGSTAFLTHARSVRSPSAGNGGGTSPLQQGGGGEKRTTPARGASCS